MRQNTRQKKLGVITEGEYLAELNAQLNKRPPEGAFTVYDVLKDTDVARETITKRLKLDKRLESGLFSYKGSSVRFYWTKREKKAAATR